MECRLDSRNHLDKTADEPVGPEPGTNVAESEAKTG
jgi:hypothetical protein